MTRRTLALIAALALTTACQDATSIPDLNNVSSTLIAGGLNRASVQLLATGLLNSDRTNWGETYIVLPESMSRDLYRIDPAENRFITQTVGIAPDPGSFVGSGLWTGYYNAIRSANNIIDNIATATDLLPAEQSATVGLAQTVKAWQYWHLLETRDTIGVAVAVDQPISAPPAPLVCKEDALAYVSALLDSGYTNLQAAGATAFPFALPDGFSYQGDYSEPATYALFNRALKGKVEYYRGIDHAKPNPGSYATAISALTQAIGPLDPATLSNSVYFTYSTAPGAGENPFAGDPAVHMNPEAGDSIMTGDLRAAKIVPNVGPYSGYGVSTTYDMAYTILTDPTNLVRAIPELKIAELILLRAQAEIESGLLTAATADVNFIHTNLGGLPAYPTFTSVNAGRSAVMYEKRYTMLFESAQRLVDLRAYGYLNATYMRMELPQDIFNSAFPIPQGESNARGGDLTVTCP